jgi:hypothetical protein
LIAVALSAIISTVAEAKQPKYSADVPKSVTTADAVETETLGTLKFFDGMPSKETVKKVYDNLDFLRGVEALLNGIPAASIYGLLEGLVTPRLHYSKICGSN